jgi:lipopolysaccharide transport system ATP-binding protein
MYNIAIKVENLSKLYQIGTPRSGSLRESLVDKWNLLTGRKERGAQDFWALKDISFEIKRGEAVGIIGKNGAGKSTLLKILSRITQPAQGRIEIEGRIASLLEVGTGFHPELTGRENVYLNGSILGMTRREIKAKFSEIVDFSGVEKFIDTPVKFYSSGMYVRLAFAVAAHLEPEILIIDEVLAVGDAEFQKKCLGKMGEVAGQGRTVLFEKGRVAYNGSAVEAVDFYLQNVSTSSAQFDLASPENKKVPGYATMIQIEDEQGNPCIALPIGRPFSIRVQFVIKETIPHFIIALGFTTLDDFPIRTTWSPPRDMGKGTYEIVFRESQVFLTSGKYKLVVGLSSREQSFQYVDQGLYCEFEDYVDKSIAVNSAAGVVLNQMPVEITRLESKVYTLS